MGGVFCAVLRGMCWLKGGGIFQATLVGEACIFERINVDNAPVLKKRRLIRVDSTHPFNPIQPSAQSFPPRLPSKSPKTPSIHPTPPFPLNPLLYPSFLPPPLPPISPTNLLSPTSNQQPSPLKLLQPQAYADED